MKNLIKLPQLFILCLVICFLSSCDGGTKRQGTKSDFATIVIEDCEYMYHQSVSYRGLVHKGNCKNPIHNCR